jgi:hypothetical protein
MGGKQPEADLNVLEVNEALAETGDLACPCGREFDADDLISDIRRVRLYVCHRCDRTFRPKAILELLCLLEIITDPAVGFDVSLKLSPSGRIIASHPLATEIVRRFKALLGGHWVDGWEPRPRDPRDAYLYSTQDLMEGIRGAMAEADTRRIRNRREAVEQMEKASRPKRAKPKPTPTPPPYEEKHLTVHLHRPHRQTVQASSGYYPANLDIDSPSCHLSVAEIVGWADEEISVDVERWAEVASGSGWKPPSKLGES